LCLPFGWEIHEYPVLHQGCAKAKNAVHFCDLLSGEKFYQFECNWRVKKCDIPIRGRAKKVWGF